MVTQTIRYYEDLRYLNVQPPIALAVKKLVTKRKAMKRDCKRNARISKLAKPFQIQNEDVSCITLCKYCSKEFNVSEFANVSENILLLPVSPPLMYQKTYLHININAILEILIYIVVAIVGNCIVAKN